MDYLSQPKLSRRKFVQRSVMAGAACSLLHGTSQAAKTTASTPAGPNLYEDIGVRPLINAKGTYTINSFAGPVAGNSMSGTVELGEYGHAQWSATKETS
jgi:hypothetical protein